MYDVEVEPVAGGLDHFVAPVGPRGWIGDTDRAHVDARVDSDHRRPDARLSVFRSVPGDMADPVPRPPAPPAELCTSYPARSRHPTNTSLPTSHRLIGAGSGLPCAARS